MSTEMNSVTSTSSAGECLASPQVLPGSEEASWITAGSGLKLFASLETYGPIGACLRTFVGSLLLSREWSSTICFLNWKATVTKSRRRSLFQLAPSTPRTAETGCGLWPTASSRDWKDTPGMAQIAFDKSGAFRNRIDQLPRMVYAVERGLWPTPRANDPEKRGDFDAMNPRNGLPAAVKMYPTPSASMMTEADMEQARYAGNDPRRPTYQQARLWPTPIAEEARSGLHCSNQTTLSMAVAALLPTPRSSDSEKGCRAPEEAAKERLRRSNGANLPAVVGGSLNPGFVEWLMGFPIGYTDCGPWAMPSSRRSSKKLVAQ